MKNAKLKTYITTTLMLLGTVGMITGCGGNKSDSNFTKEEKDEIDAAFSKDERKELEAELNGDSYDSKSDSSASVQYDETITIDPLAHISLVVSGTLPDNANIKIVPDDTSWNWDEIRSSDLDNFMSKFDFSIDGFKYTDSPSPSFRKDEKEFNVGDTVTLTINWRDGYKYPEALEERVQKNIELERTSAEIELVAGEDAARLVKSWDELTDEEKTRFIEETREYAKVYCPFDVNEDNMNTMEPVSEIAITTETGVLEPEYTIGIGYKIADDKVLYVISSSVQLNFTTGEILRGFSGSFTADPSVTDMNELATLRTEAFHSSFSDAPKYTVTEYNALQ